MAISGCVVQCGQGKRYRREGFQFEDEKSISIWPHLALLPCLPINSQRKGSPWTSIPFFVSHGIVFSSRLPDLAY
jgi:hypothetical protein